jgi:hypothetical protein
VGGGTTGGGGVAFSQPDTKPPSAAPPVAITHAPASAIIASTRYDLRQDMLVGL